MKIKKLEKKEIKKIVFYASVTRLFRTALIGNLYEIAQIYPVVLLAEEIDDKLKVVLEDDGLFPKLEEIIYVNQFSGPQKSIFERNNYLKKTAKMVINKFKPDVVITPSDNYPFEMYLLRHAKKIGSLNISLQSFNVMEGDSYRKSVDLTNAHRRFPKFLPFSIRMFLTKCRKYSGHFLYYWIMPLLVGEKPFFGKSSYILRRGYFGLRDSDYHVVFSERDLDVHMKEGIPRKKLKILPHPLTREKVINFIRSYLLPKERWEEGGDTITLLLPPDYMGFRRKDYSLISKEDRMKTRRQIIKLVSEILTDWNIYIKPHPAIKNLESIKKDFESISNQVKLVNPKEPIDKYVEISNVLVGMPKANSTALIFTYFVYPSKAVIALDFDDELLGDFYKRSEGVQYVKNEEELIGLLNSIKNGNFRKNIESKNIKGDFSDSVDLINKLFLEKHGSKK